MNIPLGYEIPTGKRVQIPVNHTVVLGQTQLSGKTTTLEAMVTRSGLRAVGFITKPGEKSFRLQTQIPPFFSESTLTDYWKYVVSIVENLMGVKLGWQERGWIVKLCQDYEDKAKAKAYKWKRPKSLRDLLANTTIAEKHLRGTAEMICMQLREYLQSVVREIGHTEFSDKLELEPGINVMDVTELSDGLKALVIRSVIEWVHKHGRRIVVIIPEAWKFIPEGRSTPVKLALEGLIREGAGVGNFVWMDSQDLRGVDKLLLRSVIVWLFGVQRQKNEVANTLASIPDHPKPTATEIMQLGKGEFYVAHGSTLVKTYVQPAGMEDAHAQAIARGDESPDSWRQISKALDDELTVESRKSKVKPPQLLQILDQESPDENEEGGNTGNTSPGGTQYETESDRGANGIAQHHGRTSGVGTDASRVTSHESPVTGPEDLMWKEKYEALALKHEGLQAEHQTLIEAHDALAARVQSLEGALSHSTGSRSANHEARITKQESPTGGNSGRAGQPPGGESAEALRDGAKAGGENGAGGPSSPAPSYEQLRDQIYRYVINRAMGDTRVLAVLVNRPEISVTINRQTIETDGATLRGALAVLLSKKFFDTPQNGNAAFNELKRMGKAVAKPNVYRELDKLAELGFVTKEETGYQAVPGMKVQIVEAGGKRLQAGAR
jgi:hypothetical protein